MPQPSRAPGPAALAALGAIQLYKWTLSALIGRQCRYLPTCSTYTADSIRAHGAWAGSWMGLARFCRCRPWGGSGYDPAPARADGVWYAPWTYGDWRGCVHDPSTPEPPKDGQKD